MPILTVNEALAGMQYPRYFQKAVTPTLVSGRPQSLWPLAGSPGAGALDATLNGVVLSGSSVQIAGQIPFVDPGVGNTHLARFTGQASQPGSLLLCDRIWHNGGINITLATAQAIVSPAWPSRDGNGAALGDGIILGLGVSVATGVGTPTITISYTNSANVAGRSAVNVIAALASSAIGAFYPIGLQAGDVGVRSVQSLTLSATWTSGTINLVAYRVLAVLDLTGANIPNAIDPITGGFPRMYNGSVPFLLFMPSTTTASNIAGQVVYSQG